MNDKPKDGANEPEMTRSQLVRRHFELYRDRYWTEMEPQFRERNASPEAMHCYREAWDVFTEGRDWEHWRDEETRRCSNEELRAEIAVYKAEIKRLGMSQSAPEQVDTRRKSLKDILSNNTAQPAAEPVHSLDRSMKR